MIERVNVLGVGISAINMDMALDCVDRWVRSRTHRYVCLRDVHGVMRCQDDEELRTVHNRAGLVTPDGMPLVWLLRWFSHKHAERVYGPDLMLAVFEAGLAKGYKHFLYGTTEETLGRLTDNLVGRFPGTEIVGRFAPPFRPLNEMEEREVARMIADSGADIVWVGLSSPKQEIWMAEHSGRVAAPVLIGVGAAFDFHAGRIRQAPRLIQRSGFEWLFRLVMEPRRLWRRYLTSIPAFVFLLLCQVTGLKRYSLD